MASTVFWCGLSEKNHYKPKFELRFFWIHQVSQTEWRGMNELNILSILKYYKLFKSNNYIVLEKYAINGYHMTNPNGLITIVLSFSFALALR